MLFIVPAIIGACTQAFDYFYPNAAKTREIRRKLTQCYTVANPERLSDIDRLISKYENKEFKLYAQVCLTLTAERFAALIIFLSCFSCEISTIQWQSVKSIDY